MKNDKHVKRKSSGIINLLKNLGLLTLMIGGLWIMLFYGKESSSIDPQEQKKGEAISICMDAVRSNSQYPSSVSFSFLNPPRSILKSDGKIFVQAAHTAKNEMGNNVPLFGYCIIKNGLVVNYSVARR